MKKRIEECIKWLESRPDIDTAGVRAAAAAGFLEADNPEIYNLLLFIFKGERATKKGMA